MGIRNKIYQYIRVNTDVRTEKVVYASVKITLNAYHAIRLTEDHVFWSPAPVFRASDSRAT